MNTFYSGLNVRYKEHVGKIYFVSEQYITICIQTFEDRLRDVCFLVYPHQWKDIKLLKESEK